MLALALALLTPANAQAEPSVTLSGHGSAFDGGTGTITVNGSLGGFEPDTTVDLTLNEVTTPVPIDASGGASFNISVSTERCDTVHHGFFSGTFADEPRIARMFTAQAFVDEVEQARDRIVMYDEGDGSFIDALSPNGPREELHTVLTQRGLDRLQPVHLDGLPHPSRASFNTLLDDQVPSLATNTPIPASPWTGVPDAAWADPITDSGILLVAAADIANCAATPGCSVAACTGGVLDPTDFTYRVTEASITPTVLRTIADPDRSDLEFTAGAGLTSGHRLRGIRSRSEVRLEGVEIQWPGCMTPSVAFAVDITNYPIVADTLTCSQVGRHAQGAANISAPGTYDLHPMFGAPEEVGASQTVGGTYGLLSPWTVSAGTCATALHDVDAAAAVATLDGSITDALAAAWDDGAPANAESEALEALLHPFSLGVQPSTFHDQNATLRQIETTADWGRFDYTTTTTALFAAGDEPVTTVSAAAETFNPTFHLAANDYDVALSWSVVTLNQILRSRGTGQLTDRIFSWDELGLVPPVGTTGDAPAEGFTAEALGGAWGVDLSAIDGPGLRVVTRPTLAPFVMTTPDGVTPEFGYQVAQLEVVIEDLDGKVRHRMITDAWYPDLELQVRDDGTPFLVADGTIEPAWLMLASDVCDFEAAFMDFPQCGPQGFDTGDTTCESLVTQAFAAQLGPVLENLFLDPQPAAGAHGTALTDEFPSPQFFDGTGTGQTRVLRPDLTTTVVEPGRVTLFGSF